MRENRNDFTGDSIRLGTNWPEGKATPEEGQLFACCMSEQNTGPMSRGQGRGMGAALEQPARGKGPPGSIVLRILRSPRAGGGWRSTSP